MIIKNKSINIVLHEEIYIINEASYPSNKLKTGANKINKNNNDNLYNIFKT